MSIIGPGWHKDSSGEGNEFTCTHLYNGRTTWTHSMFPNRWDQSPAWFPMITYLDYGGGDQSGGTPLSRRNFSNTGFVRQLSPAIFHRATMRIIRNGISSIAAVGFRVYIGSGGPTPNKAASSDPPRLERLLFSVPPIADIAYTTDYFKNNVNLNMYAGKSYGYVFIINDPVPSLPAGTVFTTNTVSFSTIADLSFGGGGIE